MSVLQYLLFEHSEDTDGCTVFDAVASTAEAQVPSVNAEVTLVLDWARDTFGDTHGPLSEGFDWDHDLQRSTERQGEVIWHTTSLTISASPAFSEAFLARFPADDPG